MHTPSLRFGLLPGGCGHAKCPPEHCYRGVRCGVTDIIQRHLDLHLTDDWFPEGTAIEDRCIFISQCDDGTDIGETHKWSCQTSSLTIMNDPRCCSSSRTLVRSLPRRPRCPPDPGVLRADPRSGTLQGDEAGAGPGPGVECGRD